MAFRLDPDRPVRQSVRDVAREQLDGALAGLADPSARGLEETVHDVRKRCKRTRGLIRLMRPGLGARYGVVNAAVRDAAQELGALRDAHATAASFERLIAATHGDRLPDAALAGVRAGLARRVAEAEETAVEPRLARAAGLLAEARDAFEAGSPGGRRAMFGGLQETYRRGRRALGAAREDGSAEALHEWRKQAKYGWYHVTLLTDAAPSVLGPLESRFDELCEGLGDDHDLAVLRELVLADPAGFGGPASAEVVTLIDAVRDDLRDRCIRLGVRLYAESPKAFARRLRRYCAAWGDVGRGRPVGELDDLAQEPADRPPSLDQREVAAPA
jgi:CHAD domain-containing protein